MNTLVLASTEFGIHLFRMNVTSTDQTERNGQILEKLSKYFDKLNHTVGWYVEFANLNTIVL